MAEIVLVVAIGFVTLLLWIHYLCETSPHVDEAGYGWGVDCFDCNLGNEDCKKCSVYKRYKKTETFVTYNLVSKGERHG